MAANDEFPRGPTTTDYQNGTGVAATVTLPAVNGVSHVIDHVSAKLVSNGTAVGFAPAIQVASVSLGTVTIEQLAVSINATASNWSTDSSDQDAHYVTIPGEAITVKFSAPAVAGTIESLRVQSHDV